MQRGDYSKGMIYSLRSYANDDVYVGSTTQTLSQRMSKHRSSYKSRLLGIGVNRASFAVLKFPGAYIELVEAFPCANKAELERREGEFIRQMHCVNTNVAGRTQKEYNDDHRVEYREYRDGRKDEKREYDAAYSAAHKAEKKVYNEAYRAAHKAEINKYNRDRRAAKKAAAKAADFKPLTWEQENLFEALYA
jgi:hypothetical protein